jgi:competence ComEA-like helix-hairpin-helix protein
LLPLPSLDFTEFDKKSEAFLKEQKNSEKHTYQYSEKTESNPETWFNDKETEKSNITNPFPFDPNTMSDADWKRLGLTTKQITTIENYKSKGGKFYKNEDFKKMYCISDEEYETLSPFITIAKTAEKSFVKSSFTPTSVTLIELNSADAEALKSIKGIGDYFATKIIQYRDRLGGFYSVEQLKEISKMDSAKYAQIVPYVEVNANALRKIAVNTADFDQLKSHPYIGYNIALSLINYREKHGNFTNIADLKKSMLITDKNFPKISKYIKVN